MSSVNNLNNNFLFNNTLQKVINLEISMNNLDDLANETLNYIKRSIKENKKTLSNYENTIKKINEKSKCPLLRLIDVISKVVLFIFKPIFYLISLPISYVIASAKSLK